ncbi:MAG: hypothetical protein M1829_002027 [Trizodia sp. TS-e1964]|nr:MAG: hypothetical protein M1829_002027 [Trizodia sp. TS-e1964]
MRGAALLFFFGFLSFQHAAAAVAGKQRAAKRPGRTGGKFAQESEQHDEFRWFMNVYDAETGDRAGCMIQNGYFTEDSKHCVEWSVKMMGKGDIAIINTDRAGYCVILTKGFLSGDMAEKVLECTLGGYDASNICIPNFNPEAQISEPVYMKGGSNRFDIKQLSTEYKGDLRLVNTPKGKYFVKFKLH